MKNFRKTTNLIYLEEIYIEYTRLRIHSEYGTG